VALFRSMGMRVRRANGFACAEQDAREEERQRA
jgi:hypothetical protein